MSDIIEEKTEKQKEQEAVASQYWSDFANSRIKNHFDLDQKEKWAEFIKKYPNRCPIVE
jgi:hypothetical protein